MSAEDLKKQGNAALQAGNVKEAILLYGQERIFRQFFRMKFYGALMDNLVIDP